MRLLFLFILIFFMGTGAYSEGPLKVGVAVSPPFVIKEGSVYSGISIDLWNELAMKLGRATQYIEYPSTDSDQSFNALKKGEIDVFVGPLSVTLDRYQKVDFTLPYFIDKVVAVSQSNYLHNIVPFLKMFIVSIGSIIAIVLLMFFCYLNLLWYYERAHTKNFPSSYKKGISLLFWTHILNGRHIEIPRSTGGKAVLLIQKVTFYVIIIILNATLISFLTASMVKYASPIQSFSDLENIKVGAIKNSKSFKAAANFGLRVVPYETINEGIEALNAGKIKAYLDDFSKAETYLKEKAETELSISHFALKRDLYAFATPIGSPLTRDINLQMLELRKEDAPQRICKEYLPRVVKDIEL